MRGDQAEVQAVTGEPSSKLTIAIRPANTSGDHAEVRELADAITGDVVACLGDCLTSITSGTSVMIRISKSGEI